MRSGIDAQTGQRLIGFDHLRQSISDILTTPIGSRVMRREYGSLLPELVDQPLHGATLLRAMAAIADAILRWEPDAQVQSVIPIVDGSGRLICDLVVSASDGERRRLTVPLGLRGITA